MASVNGNRSFARLNQSQLDPLLEESRDAFVGSKGGQSLSPREVFEKFRHDQCFQVYGCVVAGRAISYISILSYHNKDDARAIGPMYVSESVRRGGIGRYQVQELIALMEQHGVTVLFTKTWSGNSGSQAIFDAHGFKVINRIKNDRTNGDDTIEYDGQVRNNILDILFILMYSNEDKKVNQNALGAKRARQR